MAKVFLDRVSKKFGNNLVVDNVSFEVEDKAFVVIVGPSGCGKTTTLRMMAGLEQATAGDIYIEGKLVNNLPPKDRDIAMVFQNYALYPHKNVFDNMAFGLVLRKYPKEEIRQRVAEAAAMLGISELLDRKPAQLSGGQRQRVAMGRAIVRKPRVFLFDEPLSNLDAKLRVQMRAEISKFHKVMNATIVYVTHDQIEAMTLADKIVVMHEGVIVQEGNPIDVYENPDDRMVAGFIGSPSMNFVDARLEERDGGLLVEGEGFEAPVPGKYRQFYEGYAGREVVFGIRPEDIGERRPDANVSPEKAVVAATVDVIEPMGSESIVFVRVGGKDLVARINGKMAARAGETVQFLFDMDHMHLFDRDTARTVHKR